MADLNKNTGLPNELSLGRVLNDLYMAPHQIAALLSSWHAATRGTPAESAALADHATMVVTPTTYNPNLPTNPAPADSEEFVPEKHEMTFFKENADPTPPTPPAKGSDTPSTPDRGSSASTTTIGNPPDASR